LCVCIQNQAHDRGGAEKEKQKQRNKKVAMRTYTKLSFVFAENTHFCVGLFKVFIFHNPLLLFKHKQQRKSREEKGPPLLAGRSLFCLMFPLK
jgi:hypothetical protein